MRIVCAVVAVSLAVGCRDLSLNTPTDRGAITGILELASVSHVPVEGQLIHVLDAQGGARDVSSNVDGHFTASDLSPGVYVLEVKVPSFAPLVVPAVRVSAGQTTDAGTLAPIYVPPSGEFIGVVRAAGGGEVLGATVRALLEPSRAELAYGSVGADGRFTLKAPPGTFTLQASHPNYVTAELASLVITDGEQRDLTAQPLVLTVNPATLTGEVTLEREGLSDAPGVGALVSLDTGETTAVDSAGHFRLSGLGAGVRQLTVTLGSYDSSSASLVRLTAGQTTSLDPLRLRLSRGVVTGSVELSDQSGTADGVSISVTGPGYATSVAASSTMPWKGTFTLAGLPWGTWEIVASKDKYSRAATVVTIGATPTSAGLLRLARQQGDFVIDDADPTNTGGFARDPGVTLRFTGFPATGVATFRASEDPAFTGIAFAPYTGVTQPFTLDAARPDGTRTVYAQYTDTGGSTSPTFSASVVLDRAPPPVPAVGIIATGTAGPKKFTNLAQTLSVSVTGSDATAGLAGIRLSGTSDGGVLSGPLLPYALVTAFTRATMADGPQDVFVQLVDHAGNLSTAGRDSIVVDTQRPGGSLTIAQGPRADAPDFTDQLLVELGLTVPTEPEGGQIQVRFANSTGLDLDTAVLQPVRSSTSWFLESGPGDGSRTVHAVLRDSAGNESMAPISDSITLDTTAPAGITVSVPGGTVSRLRDITVLASSSASDLAALPLTVSEETSFTALNTVGPGALDGGAVFRLSATEGTRQVYARLRDHAGNAGLGSAFVTWDITPPTGALSLQGTLADGQPSATHSALPTARATLTTSGGATGYLLGSASLASCPDPLVMPYTTLPASGVVTGVPLTGSGTGLREVRACFTDAAGNTSGPVSASLFFDATPPAGCSLSLQGSLADGSMTAGAVVALNTVTATVTCTEVPFEYALLSGTVTCSASASLPWLTYQPSAPFVLPGPDGVNTVSGCVRDQAGNVSAVGPATVTLDSTPPTGVAVFINGGRAFMNSSDGLTAIITGVASGASSWSLSEAPSSFPADVVFTGASRSFTFGAAGARTLYARFTDAVGNVSALAVAQVSIDLLAPSTAGTSLTVDAPVTSGFVNGTSISVRVVAPPDAAQLELVETMTGSCATAPWSAGLPRAISTVAPLLLVAGDGLKTLCGRFSDAAGNVSAPISTTVTLDTTPPSAPSIVTPAQTLPLANGASFTVATAAAVTESNFLRYERLGGQASSWTADSTTQATTSFSFQVNSSLSAQAGVSNALRLRAVDKAGNTSAEAVVVLTTDLVKPLLPQLDLAWVDNRQGGGVLFWKPSTDVTYNATADREVASYRIYYGSSSAQGRKANYTGTNAAQGPSPITVPYSAVPQSFLLSGLVDRQPVYVHIAAVDKAGNESDEPALAVTPKEVLIDPSALSLNRIGRLSLPTAGRMRRMAIAGGYAYLVGAEYTCPATNIPTMLTVLELATIASPLRLPSLPPAQLPAVTLAPTAFSNNMDCVAGIAGPKPDLVVDPPYLFMSGGRTIRIFSMLPPGSAAAPTEIATVDVTSLAPFSVAGGSVNHLQLIGDRLFLSGNGGLAVLNVSKLYDASPGVPSTTDFDGAFTTLNGGALAFTRNRLFRFALNSFAPLQEWAIDNALDSAPGTVWDTSQLIGQKNDFNALADTNQFVSGNLLYTSSLTETVGFATWDVSRAWAEVPPFNPSKGVGGSELRSTLQVGGGGQFSVDGHLATLSNLTGTRMVSLTPSTAPLEVGFLSELPINQVLAAQASGTFELSTSTTDVTVNEIAAPRTLSTLGIGVRSAGPAEVSGGFLVTPGNVTDVQISGAAFAGSTQASALVGNCVWDAVKVGDRQVLAEGEGLRVVDLSPLLARAPAGFTAANSVAFPAAAGIRYTGLALVGNFLLATSVRSDGIYLESFDVRPLRNPLGGAFSLAGGSGATRVLALAPAVGDLYRASLSYAKGRAFVGLERHVNGYGVTTANPTLLVVDARPLIDDVAGGAPTVLGSFGSNNVSNVDALGTGGAVTLGAVRQVVLNGNYAHVASSTGLFIVDVSTLLDEDAMTNPPAQVPNGFASPGVGAIDSVAVSGNWDLAGPSGVPLNAVVRSIDSSNPLAPRVVASRTLQVSASTCKPAQEPAANPLSLAHLTVTLSGDRAYVMGLNQTTVLGFE